jgi:ElaB/YqjD/DUF883 family membrane-anchored ribosome-binding protein
MDEPHEPYPPSTAGDGSLSPEPASSDPSNKFQSTSAHAARATEDVKTAARATADDYRATAEQAWEDAQERVRTIHQESEKYVRENPTKAIFSVLCIGFVLGLIIRR